MDRCYWTNVGKSKFSASANTLRSNSPVIVNPDSWVQVQPLGPI